LKVGFDRCEQARLVAFECPKTVIFTSDNHFSRFFGANGIKRKHHPLEG